MRKEHSDIDTVNEALRRDRAQHPEQSEFHLSCMAVIGLWLCIVAAFLFVSKAWRAF